MMHMLRGLPCLSPLSYSAIFSLCMIAKGMMCICVCRWLQVPVHDVHKALDISSCVCGPWRHIEQIVGAANENTHALLLLLLLRVHRRPPPSSCRNYHQVNMYEYDYIL